MNRVTFAVLIVVSAVAPSILADGPRYVRTVPVAEQPIVEDSRTGYLWQGCPAGLTGASCTTGSDSMMNWQSALAYCEGLDWGGRTDWYLPNVTELTSIVDDSRISPSIDTTAFPATPSSYSWSSSSYSGSSSYAWHVNFSSGNVSNLDKTNSYYVRCIRRGP
ncbi:MAG: DUF1566 domain-containing protein [Myxococcota bacterium]|nr:DUF1566 domain-containing protein [Myxococcota bacterium]